MLDGYTVHDHRGEERPQEVCRVCGSREVHSTNYNHPTMKCIEYLRKQIQELEKRLEKRPDEYYDGEDNG